MHSMTPPQAIESYLARPRNSQPQCTRQAFEVQIDAALPRLNKQGSMSGLKIVSKTGRTIYRGLQFTGDTLVRTAVIARFLASESDPPEQSRSVGVNRENYFFTYERAASYNGVDVYVFRIKPKHPKPGLFRGELWLDTISAEPLRIWGDLVKSPSLFVGSFRFVQDYQNVGCCVQPLRLLVSVQTRIAGRADMTVWQRPVDEFDDDERTDRENAGSPRPAGRVSSNLQ